MIFAKFFKLNAIIYHGSTDPKISRHVGCKTQNSPVDQSREKKKPKIIQISNKSAESQIEK